MKHPRVFHDREGFTTRWRSKYFAIKKSTAAYGPPLGSTAPQRTCRPQTGFCLCNPEVAGVHETSLAQTRCRDQSRDRASANRSPESLIYGLVFTLKGVTLGR